MLFEHGVGRCSAVVEPAPLPVGLTERCRIYCVLASVEHWTDTDYLYLLVQHGARDSDRFAAISDDFASWRCGSSRKRCTKGRYFVRPEISWRALAQALHFRNTRWGVMGTIIGTQDPAILALRPAVSGKPAVNLRNYPIAGPTRATIPANLLISHLDRHVPCDA
jgi:hypothetical protein